MQSPFGRKGGSFLWLVQKYTKSISCTRFTAFVKWQYQFLRATGRRADTDSTHGRVRYPNGAQGDCDRERQQKPSDKRTEPTAESCQTPDCGIGKMGKGTIRAKGKSIHQSYPFRSCPFPHASWTAEYCHATGGTAKQPVRENKGLESLCKGGQLLTGQ